MQLVVNRQHVAVMVDDVNRIVGARDPHAGRQVGARTEPVTEPSPWQQIGDLGHRVGFAGQEKRKRGFRPDQDVDVATPVDSGPDARSENVRYFFITSALAE